MANEAAGNAALFTECVLTNRFSSDAFFLLLKGKKAKAIKRFHKQKRLLSYERRILNLLESGETISTSDVSAVNKCLESYNDMGVQKAGFKELSAMFISWLVLTPVNIACLFRYILFGGITAKTGFNLFNGCVI